MGVYIRVPVLSPFYLQATRASHPSPASSFHETSFDSFPCGLALQSLSIINPAPMASPNLPSANDIEKGHSVTFDPSQPQNPSDLPSPRYDDPLSPSFGATRTPARSLMSIPILTLDGTLSGASSQPNLLSLDREEAVALPYKNMKADPASNDTQSPRETEKIAIPEKALVKIDQKLTEVQLQKAEIQHVEVAKPVSTVTPQTGPQATKWVKFTLFFNTYRKFFTFVVILNGTGIIMAALDRFDYARNNNGALILGNLLMAVMMRNELFLRVIFLVVNTCLAKWPPLWVRLAATSALQHLGGIHSGCAVSGLGWLCFRVVELCIHATANHKAVIATGIVTNLAVITSVISAFPWVRNTHHNIFERHHRFIGWLGLVMTWAFVILGNGFDPKRGAWDWSANYLIRTQDFYFVLGMTIFIGLPWTFTRKVEVHVEIPSPKVAILRFNRGMQQGLLGRISRTSVMEYHAFGIISEGKDAKYHYMVCGVQGDFTRGLVEDPPKQVWTRELKFAGVSNTSTLYKRGIRICTGTGIGAALSTCLQNKNWFLIWIGSDNEKTFGKTVSDMIERGIEPERRILWDSKKLKRPDTMKLLKETYEKWDAEVVFITSNYQGNTQMMEGCKMLGIPAFGTLWDF